MKHGAKHYYAARVIFLCVLLLLLLAVTGCSKVIYKPVEVEVIVPVPCVDTVPTKPVWETSRLNKNSSLNDAANAYMIERRQRIGYEAELEALVNSCAQLPPVLGTGEAQDAK